MIKIIIVGVLLFVCGIEAQQKAAVYEDLSPNFLSNFDKPVGIAIFPFTYNGSQNDIDSKFYSEMTSALDKQSSFIINHYKKLTPLKDSWEIKNWDPQNSKLLKKLDSELDIKLVVYAICDNSLGTSFQLKIISTENGSVEFSEKYQSSINSDAIKDAIKIFSDGLKTIYSSLGKAIIKVTPSTAEIKIDGNLYINENELNLPIGKHEVRIRKEGYREIKEQLDIRTSEVFTKQYELIAQKGFLTIKLDIKDYNVFIKDGDKIIANWKGDAYSKEFKPGKYTLEVSLEGYKQKSRIIEIRDGETITENVHLEKETSVVNKESEQIDPNNDGYSTTWAVVKSALLPGLGQMTTGRGIGWLYLLAEGGAVFYYFYSVNDFNKNIDEYNSSKINFYNSISVENLEKVQSSYNSSKESLNNIKIAVGVVIAVYAINLLDALIYTSNSRPSQFSFTPEINNNIFGETGYKLVLSLKL